MFQSSHLRCVHLLRTKNEMDLQSFDKVLQQKKAILPYSSPEWYFARMSAIYHQKIHTDDASVKFVSLHKSAKYVKIIIWRYSQ